MVLLSAIGSDTMCKCIRLSQASSAFKEEPKIDRRERQRNDVTRRQRQEKQSRAEDVLQELTSGSKIALLKQADSRLAYSLAERRVLPRIDVRPCTRALTRLLFSTPPHKGSTESTSSLCSPAMREAEKLGNRNAVLDSRVSGVGNLK